MNDKTGILDKRKYMHCSKYRNIKKKKQRKEIRIPETVKATWL